MQKIDSSPVQLSSIAKMKDELHIARVEVYRGVKGRHVDRTESRVEIA